jgi:hypothetical protein
MGRAIRRNNRRIHPDEREKRRERNENGQVLLRSNRNKKETGINKNTWLEYQAIPTHRVKR